MKLYRSLGETLTFYNPMNDQRMPYLTYDYFVERKAGYYVYKLIIPIVFLYYYCCVFY